MLLIWYTNEIGFVLLRSKSILQLFLSVPKPLLRETTHRAQQIEQNKLNSANSKQKKPNHTFDNYTTPLPW